MSAGSTSWEIYCALQLAGDLAVLGPKCNTVACLEPAAARVHWVTGPMLTCSGCADHWQAIAQRGFGMHLLVEPVHYMPGGADDTEQRMRLLEL